MAHLFQHLIRKANHETRKWQGRTIERGQIVTSLASLKAQTGISTRTLRTCLDRLKSTNEVTNISTSQYRVITINNYKTYQSYGFATDKQNDKPSDKQLTSDRQTTDKQPTTNNNVNNVNNEEQILPLPPQLKNTEISRKLANTYTIQDCKDACNLLGIPESNAQSYFDQYDSQGWLKASNVQITCLRSHMAKRWNKSKQCWDFDEGKQSKEPKLPPPVRFADGKTPRQREMERIERLKKDDQAQRNTDGRAG